MSKFKIVIVGGGTAGWLSALFVRERMPSAEITLIESEAIGILGAGEGTTPAFVPMLDDLKIPLSRLVKETNCTLKNGIKFTNWRGDDDFYYHGFLPTDPLGFPAFDTRTHAYDIPLLALYGLATDRNPADLSHIPTLSEQNKVPFYVHPQYQGQFIANSMDKYVVSANYAVHFDAVALAAFFKKVGTEERNITRIEGKVVSHTKKLNENLEKVVLESGEEIAGDFFIDCTGFAKKFVGRTYESEWVSHKEHLTVDSAMPFFLDIDPDNIPAYTESTAMKHGWLWKIPLQHRYGCGYVFDSSYITDEEARKEIVEFLGEEPAEWPRDTSIKFEPGYFKTPWVNNCLAVGLSGGFIEPLEATSIWVTVMSLREAFKDTQFIVGPNKNYSEEFNAHMVRLNEYVFRFVYAHYMGGRTDTDFWKHYQNLENMPKSLKTLMEPWKYRQMTYKDFKLDLFPAESWAQVYAGLGLSDVDIAKKSYNSNHMPDDIEPYYGQYLEANNEVVEACLTHAEILEDLRNAPDILPAQ